MYVLDPEPLSEGSAIKFALRLGTFDIPIKGIVSRSVAGHGMVIQFTEMTREAKRRLKSIFPNWAVVPGNEISLEFRLKFKIPAAVEMRSCAACCRRRAQRRADR